MPLGNGQVGFAIKRHQREIKELIGKIDLANIPWSAKLIVEGITLCCVVSVSITSTVPYNANRSQWKTFTVA